MLISKIVDKGKVLDMAQNYYAKQNELFIDMGRQ